MVLESSWYVLSLFIRAYGVGRFTNFDLAQNFPKARERLEDLKKGGSKAGLRGRERISRSKVGKANEGECAVM